MSFSQPQESCLGLLAWNSQEAVTPWLWPPGLDRIHLGPLLFYLAPPNIPLAELPVSLLTPREWLCFMQMTEKAQRNKTLMAKFQAKRQVNGDPCESKGALRKSPFPQSAVLRSPRLDTHLHPPSTNCKPASLPPASWSMPGSLHGKKTASSCSASLCKTRNPLPLLLLPLRTLLPAKRG